MKKTIVVLICLLLTVAVGPLFAKKNKPAPSAEVSRYVVVTGKGTHELAPKAAEHAQRGLSNASTHSPAIQPADGKGGATEVNPKPQK
jgi:hypothetical protein